MPLPVGHSLMGFALYDTSKEAKQSTSWGTIALFIIVANLADIDFLPGLILGQPNHFHHHFLSHSFGAAIMVGLIIGGYFYFMKRRSFVASFLLFAGVYFSHIVLDFFTADTSLPKGVPILWPFSETYYISPVTIFMSVHKDGASTSSFLRSLFVGHNFWVILRELLVFVPVLTIMKLNAKRRDLRAERKARGAEREAITPKTIEGRG